MSQQTTMAIAAGGVSALLFFGLFAGFFPGAPLAALTAVPLFAAGLGIGMPAAVIAAVFGTVAIAFVVTVMATGEGSFFPAVITFLALHAIPAVILSRQALLSRQTPQGQEWYPTGLLVCWLVGIVAGYFALALVIFALQGPGLLAVIEGLITATAEALRDANPDLFGDQAPISPDNIPAIAPFIPGIFAASIMVFVVISGALAQSLLTRFKRNIRPSGDFTELELPMPMLYGFGVSLALSLTTGSLGMIGKTLAVILAVAYLLQGLAVLHAWARRWKGATVVLTLLYLALILVWPAPVLVVGLGLVEQVAHLRRRGAGSGPGAEDE